MRVRETIDMEGAAGPDVRKLNKRPTWSLAALRSSYKTYSLIDSSLLEEE